MSEWGNPLEQTSSTHTPIHKAWAVSYTHLKSIRAIINEKEEQKLQKKNDVFMYGISSFMVVVVLLIGINLMNSYEKMKNLDQSLSSIASVSYTHLDVYKRQVTGSLRNGEFDES